MRSKVLSIAVAGACAAAGFVGFSANAAVCAGATVTNGATATFEDVTITITESQRSAACVDGAIGQGPTSARLVITKAGLPVCDRTDVDPGYDPFGFGAGIHNNPADSCGGEAGWVSFDPVTPDPARPGTVHKNAPATGSVWWVGGSVDGADSSATTWKTVSP